MRNTFIIVLVVLVTVVFAFNLSADGGKKYNLFLSSGVSTSDVDGPFAEIGIQARVLKSGFFGELSAEYYFSPAGEDSNFVDWTVYGFNLAGVYKFKISDGFNLFAKAGVHATTIKADVDFPTVGQASVTDSDFGLLAGAGLEYLLGESLGIHAGVTLKYLIGEDTSTWYKLYGGIGYYF